LGGKALPQAGQRLSLLTWNVGYAGMGAESDFVADKGSQLRPLSADLVERNLAEITGYLTTRGSVDLILLQEVARPSFSTHQIDTLEALVAARPDSAWMFGADIDTLHMPQAVSLHIGNATFSRVDIAEAERRGLTLEPTFQLGIFRKGYRIHIARLAGPQGWVIANVHLSAFDSEEVSVREEQLREVIRWGEAEYAAGRRVVIGGDWNLRLADTTFPHTTDEEFRFWVRDLPRELLPEGWRFVADPDRPTVRTAHKPYVRGENYRLIVDGFLVSPNVGVISVETSDLDFRFADHNPVTVVVEAR
jgi:endonuclease/exonuclease/phosphatase family metal-dependent hydrolase